MTIDAIGPSNYTDVQGLNTLRTQARAQDPEALRSTAKQFETIFTKMMLQSMRDARLGEDIFGSSAGDMYQSMFDDQIALEMSRGQGIGIAEMLLEQLKRSSSPTPAPTSTPRRRVRQSTRRPSIQIRQSLAHARLSSSLSCLPRAKQLKHWGFPPRPYWHRRHSRRVGGDPCRAQQMVAVVTTSLESRQTSVGAALGWSN
jgi:Rod binding domain-containing protein